MDRRRFLRGAVGGAAAGFEARPAPVNGGPSASGVAPRVERPELVALATELARTRSCTTEETACARFVPLAEICA